MDKIQAVRAMQEYIDDHFTETITLSDLSKASLYSPWYSYRLFIDALNMTPSDYIRRLRLSKSALRLRDNKEKILDLALEYGYSSVDGYQRAFLKEFGTNPFEYSQNPKLISLFIPYKIYSKKEIKLMEDVKNVFITVITKPNRKVIIKRGIKAIDYMSYCGEVGCDVWGELVSMKSTLNEPVCMWLPEKYIKPGTSKYVQGVEVKEDYSGDVPSGYDIISLPEATYLMFQGEPFKEEDFEEAISALWKSIDNYNPEPIGYDWDLTNPKIQLEPIGTRGYIELLPVKKLTK